MNLNQLRVFDAVARTGSFSRAAETLSVTQPAVTLQIRQLERDCGVQLFERIRRRPRLSEAGQRLQEYARRIFALVDEAGRHLEGARGLSRGRLRVVTGPTGSAYAADLMAAFHRRHPGIELALSLDTSERIVQRIVALDDDIGLVGAEQKHPALARTPFRLDPLVVIVAPRHPWARRRTVSVRELAEAPLIVREAVSTTRRFIETRLGAAARRLRVAMELGSNGAIKHAVESGLGLAVISRYACALEVSSGRLVELHVRGFPIRRDWHIVHLRKRKLPASVRAFIEFLQETSWLSRNGSRGRVRPPTD